MGRLKVKGKYLYEDNKPFFWLGDTAWELFTKLNKEEIILYLKNRRGLGFNVIQTILILDSCKNYSDMNYWSFINEIVDYANDLGMYMALFPIWGATLKKMELSIIEIKRYAEFLTSFFKQDNIIWVLGGDIRGDYSIELFDAFGKAIKENDKNRLVTFHPFGRTGSYLWFNNCEWLDFNMFQSGHRRYDQLDVKSEDDSSWDDATFGESNYKYVIKNFTYEVIKPCLDGEPSYEGVVQGLHNPLEPYWEARHIRRYAYFNAFEGACGHTYGNNAIIQFHNIEDEGKYGVRESWLDALHSPGGAQMQYLKRLMESIDFVNGAPHPEYIIDQKIKCDRVSVFAGEEYILCYTYIGDAFKLNLSNYKNINLTGYWINPENDSKSLIGSFIGKDVIVFKPIKRNELSNDWILLLIKE